MGNRAASRVGITLVEVLIVLFMLSLLVQMMLPAVEMSREAARRTECANHLHQLSLGVIGHVSTHGYYPSGGWGSVWVGDPDRGTGPDQPGSWAFNILDYIEQTDLRQAGSGLDGTSRMEAISRICETPIALFYCSSRRLPRAYSHSNSEGWITLDGNQKLPIDRAARSDYAINTGDQEEAQFSRQYVPISYEQANSPNFPWFDTSTYVGISFGRSQVEPRQVIDGMSKTYMIGEKFIPSAYYKDGKFKADNECMYSGFDNDNGRSAKHLPRKDRDFIDDYMSPRAHINDFGSAHPTVWQVAFCDGSVRSLTFDIDLQIHGQFGNRQDGKVSSGDE